MWRQIDAQRKYAVFKAKYIRECLREGRVPVAGPLDENGQPFVDLAGFGEDDGGEEAAPNTAQAPSSLPAAHQPSLPPTQPQPPRPQPGHIDPPPPVTHAPQPVKPAAAASSSSSASFGSTTSSATAMAASAVSIDTIEKANKHCKFAMSALQYMDVKTAVQNLQDALSLLTTPH